MIDLPYSLVITATDDPGFFGCYSEELAGFTDAGHSNERPPSTSYYMAYRAIGAMLPESWAGPFVTFGHRV